jgi:branched-chain amino acid transport system permease protein
MTGATKAHHTGRRTADRMTGRNGIATMVILVVAIGLLIVMPFFLTDFLQLLMTKFLAFAIFGMAYNLVYGYTGMLSLGHGAFFGIGAYTAGLLTLHTSITSLWVALPLAIVGAAAGAAVFSLFFLRVSGTYFLLITFGFSQLMYALTWNIKWFNKPGMQGIADIKFPTVGVSGFTWNHRSLYFLTLAFFVICYFLINAIINSPFGHALVGVRENENRMRALGYNVWAFRYTALVMSGAFCGLAGLLFAYNGSFVYPNHLGFDYSWIPMLVVILGGAGTKLGPIVGAGIVVWFEYFISLLTPQRWPLILGALFIAVIMYFRGGVVAYVTRLFQKAGKKHEPAAS